MIERIGRSSRRAVVFLILFALPFAGGGTFVGYLAGSMALTWARAQSWEETPALILSADLDVNHGDDSTTYRVDAQYEYVYRGSAYRSDVVGMGFGSDNIGSFHQDKYAELQPYAGSKRLFRCYVNPENPSEAILYRDMRWGLLGLELIFAIVFAGVGYGLMFVAVWGGRLVAAEDKLEQTHRGEPWRWKRQWAGGKIHAGAKGKAIGTLLFATLWNLISAPMLFVVPAELANGNRLAAIGLLFPAVGLLLIGMAARAFLQWRKFGSAIFEMSSVPGVLGGYLEGTIQTSVRTRPADGFRLTLSCIRNETSGSGENRSTTERVLWQDTVPVPIGKLSRGPNGVSIPVRLGIPSGAGPQSDVDGSDTIEWRLEAEAAVPGVDFGARFEVPVFETDDSDPDFSPALGAGSGAAAADPVEELRAAGIVNEPLPAGGRLYVFRRARLKGAAVGMTVFTAIWMGFLWLMISLGAPILFPIVFGLFAILMTWAVLDMWLTERRVELGAGTLTLTKRMLASGKRLTFRRDDVARIKPSRGMQAGSKLYYRIELETRGGRSHILASRLDNQRLARRLIEDFEAALAS